MAHLPNNAGTDLLFSEYIDVVNLVIKENRDGLYGKLIKLWEKAFGDEMMALGVYEHEADEPHSWYTIKFSGGRIVIVSNSKDLGAKWKVKVKECYLEEVVENAEAYVEHPIKLDLDWLKARIGLC